MRRGILRCGCVALLLIEPLCAGALSDADVQLLNPEGSLYQLTWREPSAVDVCVSARPDAKMSAMRKLVSADGSGRLEVRLPDLRRPYFLLRAADGSSYRIGPRLLPLQGGSNFRDLGGYPGADGKRIRWGRIYRSAAMPKLTDADYAYLSALSIKTVVDLRSVDERELSPTHWRAKPAVRAVAVDYPGDVIFERLRGFNGPEREAVTERLYAELPTLLREEYRAVFKELLAHAGPLVISDSDGQDRTGIAAALMLSALGTPREVIDRDYLLSIEDRRPANEMADVDLEEFAKSNSEARFLIAYRTYAEKTRDLQRSGTQAAAAQTLPLRDSKGRPLLQIAFDRLQADYGSVADYLDRELGVKSKDIARLRALYLE